MFFPALWAWLWSVGLGTFPPLPLQGVPKGQDLLLGLSCSSWGTEHPGCARTNRGRDGWRSPIAGDALLANKSLGSPTAHPPQLISHPPNPTKEPRSDKEGTADAVGQVERTDPSRHQAQNPNNPIPKAALTSLQKKNTRSKDEEEPRAGKAGGGSSISRGIPPSSPEDSAQAFCLPGASCHRERLFLDLTLTAPSKPSPKSFQRGHNRDNQMAAAQELRLCLAA